MIIDGVLITCCCNSFTMQKLVSAPKDWFADEPEYDEREAFNVSSLLHCFTSPTAGLELAGMHGLTTLKITHQR